MNQPKLTTVLIFAAALCCFPGAGRAQQKSLDELKDPQVAKSVIEQILRAPKSPVETTAIFYGEGVSHADGFIPCNSTLTDHIQSKYYNKFTYENGRVVKCEGFDETGKSSGYFAVWNNSVGAPVVSGHFNLDGSGNWYMYADYGSPGKLKTLYRFGQDFKMLRYEQFSYGEGTTHIESFTPEGRLENETWYENGGVFVTIDGKKTKVNTGTREQTIRELVKYGLKPMYPGY